MSKEKLNPDFEKWLRENNPRHHKHVPEGYFETFPDVIIEKIKQDQKRTIIKPLHNRRTLYWGIAASLIILLAAIFLLRLEFGNNTIEFTALEEDQTWEYVMAYTSDFELGEFADFDELDEAITELETEFFTYQLTDDFFDEIDMELIENIYK